MDDKLANLRKRLQEESLDAVFISSISNIAYLTGYAGFMPQDRDGFLLITRKNQYIFTHGIYKEDVKKRVKNFTLIDIMRENPISQSVKSIVEKENITKLGFEAFDLKVSEFERLTKHIDKKILQQTNLIEKLRIYKTTNEMKALKEACKLGDICYSDMLKKIRIGVTENELAAELEFSIKKHGADISFATIVAFEENAAHPHHMPTDKKLTANSFVLFDFGVLLDGYCSDMSRTITFGKASKSKNSVYKIVLEAQERAITFIEKKLVKNEIIRTKAVDKVARGYIMSEGYPSMPHSLGHGIGLEVHESPRLTPISEELLAEGMIFSIEPGIYIPDKFGVRIEDLFAIHNNKLIQLTNSPRNLIEL